jgi:hypothetical protein
LDTFINVDGLKKIILNQTKKHPRKAVFEYLPSSPRGGISRAFLERRNPITAFSWPQSLVKRK